MKQVIACQCVRLLSLIGVGTLLYAYTRLLNLDPELLKDVIHFTLVTILVVWVGLRKLWSWAENKKEDKTGDKKENKAPEL